VHILPDEYRKETIEELKSFIAEHNKRYNTTIDHAFTHIFSELEKPFDLYAAQKFMWNTKKIDELRNEDTFDVIPEMKVVREIVGRAQ
jgi:hypothetical protein